MGWGDWKLPTVPPEYRRHVQQAERVLRRADATLGILWRARGGGVLDATLAGAAFAGEVLSLLTPTETPHDMLLRTGYQLLDTGVAGFLVEQIGSTVEVTRESVSFDPSEGTRIEFWSLPERPRAVAAVFHDRELESGPYVAEGQLALLKTLIRRSVWLRGNDLVLEPRSMAFSSVGSGYSDRVSTGAVALTCYESLMDDALDEVEQGLRGDR